MKCRNSEHARKTASANATATIGANAQRSWITFADTSGNWHAEPLGATNSRVPWRSCHHPDGRVIEDTDKPAIA